MDERAFLLEEKYAGVESPAFEIDLKRLREGEPLAYIIGWIPFLDCKIFLDSHPLIPRPETEFWTEKAITEIITIPTAKVLDVFAGSGAIGVAVLKHVPTATVDFGEIDESHFPTIRKNILENKIAPERAKVMHTDVLASISGKYDFILTNPPYISESRIDRVQNSVLSHEPKNALFAGEEGFSLIRILIETARKNLTPKGVLFIEHEPEQETNIKICAKKADCEATSFEDQFGLVRFSRLSPVA